MGWDPKQLKEKAKEDFEAAWMGSITLLPQQSSFKPKANKGNEHKLATLMTDIRQLFLANHFDECVLPPFVEAQDVYMQYGPEAPIILDRCYYLAGLPRPDIGISEERYGKIMKIAPTFSPIKKKAFETILRRYKKGDLSGDDFIEEMVTKLGLRMEQATHIIDTIFPEFKSLTPEPTQTTLRSHMTAAWFGTLQSLQFREPLPIQLFTIGLRFRREQKLDATHLRSHFGASCVVMDDGITIEDGMKLTEALLAEIGFTEFEFEKKAATSKYYAPATEYEVYANSPLGKKVEIADIGMYSPIALSNYDISHPVFNLGFGLERLAMILYNINDVRALEYPQFYSEWKLTDADIAKLLTIRHRPKTELGKQVAQKIVKTCELYCQHKSPCEFKVFEKEIGDNKLEVFVLEPEEEKSLCGPAYINEIYVCEGNILAIPPTGFDDKDMVKLARKSGAKSGLRLINAFADVVGAEVEKDPLVEREFKVKNVTSAADVNIDIPAVVNNYITANKKTISIRGPMFITVRTKVTKLWAHLRKDKMPKTILA